MRGSLKYIFMATMCLFVTCGLSAQNVSRLDTTRTSLLIPRPALEPLKSLIRTASDPVDTLDTANEHIKVILYGDNTWQYYKTPGFQQVAGVYDSNWNDSDTNPYDLQLQDLPAEIRLLVGQEIPPCQKLFRIGHRRDQVVLGAEPLLDILLHEGLQDRPLQGADQVFK